MKTTTKAFINELGEKLQICLKTNKRRMGVFTFPIEQDYYGAIAVGSAELSDGRLSIWLHGQLFSEHVSSILAKGMAAQLKPRSLPLVAMYFSGGEIFDPSSESDFQAKLEFLVSLSKDEIIPSIKLLPKQIDELEKRLSEPLVPPEIVVSYHIFKKNGEVDGAELAKIASSFSGQAEIDRANRFVEQYCSR